MQLWQWLTDNPYCPPQQSSTKSLIRRVKKSKNRGEEKEENQKQGEEKEEKEEKDRVKEKLKRSINQIWNCINYAKKNKFEYEFEFKFGFEVELIKI